jgi:hypothetical protein
MLAAKDGKGTDGVWISSPMARTGSEAGEGSGRRIRNSGAQAHVRTPSVVM